MSNTSYELWGGINIMVKMKDVEKAFCSQAMVDYLMDDKGGE